MCVSVLRACACVLQRKMCHMGVVPRRQGMEGARIGIWCAHGEGRAHFPDPSIRDQILESNLAPIRCDSKRLVYL